MINLIVCSMARCRITLAEKGQRRPFCCLPGFLRCNQAPRQRCGPGTVWESRAVNGDLLVHLSGQIRRDRHGSLVCLAFVEGKDADLEMLKRGFAWADSRDFPEAPPKMQTSYREAADEARASRLGLRIDANPKPP